MNSIVGIMKEVAAREMSHIYTTELGVVTAIFPHASDSDKDNYQCSVSLKNRTQPDGQPFELRKVPVAVSHIGAANIPNVDDLVLVQFIGGDLNAPVITGRLYNEEARPPKNDAGDVVLTNLKTLSITLDSGTKIEIDADGNVTIDAQGDVIINQGDKGAARKDDQVEVTIPSGSFVQTPGGPAAVGVLNPAPVKVQGKITSASQTVKIG